jgi:hypothetical protein
MPERDATDFARTSAFLLAWQCLRSGEFDGATLVVKAKWLISMGFSRSDAAFLLGSSDESLRVMLGAEARKATTKPS